MFTCHCSYDYQLKLVDLKNVHDDNFKFCNPEDSCRTVGFPSNVHK